MQRENIDINLHLEYFLRSSLGKSFQDMGSVDGWVFCLGLFSAVGSGLFLGGSTTLTTNPNRRVLLIGTSTCYSYIGHSLGATAAEPTLLHGIVEIYKIINKIQALKA